MLLLYYYSIMTRICQKSSPLKRKTVHITIAVFLFFSIGCTSSIIDKRVTSQPAYERPVYGDAERMKDSIGLLEKDLNILLGHKDEESLKLAKAAFKGSKELSQKYKAFRPAWFHNTLINMDIKKRGLCCHWTQDLLELLIELDLKKFDLLWGVSGFETFHEHSSVVAVRKGQPFDSGIVLDPWRYAGDLYWTKVRDDSYEWHRHPDDDGTVIIGCNGLRKKKIPRRTKNEGESSLEKSAASVLEICPE